jgi:hypothetical protein
MSDQLAALALVIAEQRMLLARLQARITELEAAAQPREESVPRTDPADGPRPRTKRTAGAEVPSHDSPHDEAHQR